MEVTELSNLYNNLMVELSKLQGIWLKCVYFATRLYNIKECLYWLEESRKISWRRQYLICHSWMSRILSKENGSGLSTVEAWAKIWKSSSSRRRFGGLYRNNKCMWRRNRDQMLKDSWTLILSSLEWHIKVFEYFPIDFGRWLSLKWKPWYDQICVWKIHWLQDNKFRPFSTRVSSPSMASG